MTCRINIRRQRPELDRCKTCGNKLYFFNNGIKKVKINGTKQLVQEKDFCDLKCSKKKCVFFQKINMVLQTDNYSDYLVAQYCLWKMLRRTPLTELAKILESKMKSAIEVKT